jgi:hypothetical protein
MGWSFAALSGTGCSTSQCSTTLPFSKRKMSALVVGALAFEILTWEEVFPIDDGRNAFRTALWLSLDSELVFEKCIQVGVIS